MKGKIRKLLAQADACPFGFAQADLVKEAVRLADVSQDKELQFKTRVEYLSAACFSGRGKEMVVAYSWLLNHLDQYGAQEEKELLWPLKWVLGAVVSYSEFSASQVDYFFKDASNRYLDYRKSPRPLLILEASYRIQQGRIDEAERLLKLATRAKRDDYADCVACEPTSLAGLYLLMGDAEKAVTLLEKSWSSGKTCGEEPARGRVSGALAYSLCGKEKEALACHQFGYPKICRTDNMATFSWYSLAYKLRANRLHDALSILDRHIELFFKTMHKRHAFFFFKLGHQLMEKYRQKGRETLSLKSYRTLPGKVVVEDGVVSVSEFGKLLLNSATTIGEAFDKRNESQRFKELISSNWPLD